MIRKITIGDMDHWRKLYKSYAEFYKSQINNKILDTVWIWLNDEKHELRGIVYKIYGNLRGLAHYRAWITLKDNTYAKSLYDKISKKTNCEVYEWHCNIV